ncbi:hypothetical protein ROHU_001296 [Labeo rohita]|uniref:Uncharacterized protein n=1 Tax=Labeo rohita TaxID=84645 RepID=A0A498P0W1_LABRO|nr:hypothetical protein ROHU_001296 [Labeo rohita]
MASVVPLRGLVIFLCLLHLCVQGIQDVNTVCLAKMTQYFYDKVQPKTKNGTDAQYALSIYLPPAHCVDRHANIKNKFDNDEAAQGREKMEQEPTGAEQKEQETTTVEQKDQETTRPEQMEQKTIAETET